ncbi:MAG: hypothetical protein AAF683_01715 [Pseudomonadota bacterium]
MTNSRRRLLKMSDLPQVFGFGLTKVYELKRDDPSFPKPASFGRMQVYDSVEVEEYISKKFEARDVA